MPPVSFNTTNFRLVWLLRQTKYELHSINSLEEDFSPFPSSSELGHPQLSYHNTSEIRFNRFNLGKKNWLNLLCITCSNTCHQTKQCLIPCEVFFLPSFNISGNFCWPFTFVQVSDILILAGKTNGEGYFSVLGKIKGLGKNLETTSKHQRQGSRIYTMQQLVLELQSP